MGYKSLFLSIGLLFSTLPAQAGLYQGDATVEFASFHYNLENCTQADNEEFTFHKGLFFPDGDLKKRGLSSLYPMEEVAAASIRTYQADERLGYRVFLNESGEFSAPLGPYDRDKDGNMLMSKMSPALIAGMVSEMEDIIEKGQAQWINYLDMGHTHPNLPHENISLLDRRALGEAAFQNKIMDDPELALLYHLSEKVDFYMGQDNVLAKLYDVFINRNYLGFPFSKKASQNLVQEDGKGANTFRFSEEDHYAGLGKTIYFHGNKNGCFQVQTSKGPINFDIGLVIPDSDPEVLANDAGM